MLHHLGRRLDPLRRTHQDVNRAEPFLLEPKRLADAALQPVALRSRRVVLARDENAEPRPSGGAPLDEEGVSLGPQALPPSQQPLEIGFAAQPSRWSQAEPLRARRRGDYSASRRRPRARRLRSTLRPPAVRLRTRNPESVTLRRICLAQT